jgi:hypothetical protein
VRIRGKKTIHSSFQALLDRIKRDTSNFASILEGLMEFTPDETETAFEECESQE